MIPSSFPRPPISSPSIPDRFFGLISGVAEHLLALFSLASLEAQELFKKTITLLLLLIVIVAALPKCYVSVSVLFLFVYVFCFWWVEIVHVGVRW